MSRYNQSEVKNHYKDFYAGKAFDKREYNLYTKYFRLLQKSTRLSRVSGNTLLDLGCGHGVKTMAFASFFKHTLAVDLSESAIDSAKRINTNPNIDFVCEDVYQLEKQQFDVISALGFSLFNEEDTDIITERILSITNEFLQPNGAVVFSSQTDFSGKSVNGWAMHSNTQLEQLMESLGKHGFHVELCFPQKKAANYLNFGVENLLKETVKVLRSKRRVYFLVLTKA